MFIVMSPPYANRFPAAGTLLSTYCSGTTKMGHYADGNGGTYDGTIAVNSTECGYDPNLQGGGGQLRVNVQWDGADDMDIIVRAPDGYSYGFGQGGGGNGVWDHDSTSAGQENVAWNPTAPNGLYSVTLTNYAGNDPGTVVVTVILNGVSRSVDMSAYIPDTAGGKSSHDVQFTITNGAFSVQPHVA